MVFKCYLKSTLPECLTKMFKYCIHVLTFRIVCSGWGRVCHILPAWRGRQYHQHHQQQRRPYRWWRQHIVNSWS